MSVIPAPSFKKGTILDILPFLAMDCIARIVLTPGESTAPLIKSVFPPTTL